MNHLLQVHNTQAPIVSWIVIFQFFNFFWIIKAVVTSLQQILPGLPPSNREILRRVLPLLSKVVSHSYINKMSAFNIATVSIYYYHLFIYLFIQNYIFPHLKIYDFDIQRYFRHVSFVQKPMPWQMNKQEEILQHAINSLKH